MNTLNNKPSANAVVPGGVTVASVSPGLRSAKGRGTPFES